MHDPATAETTAIVSPLISTACTAGLSVVPPAWIQCLPPHLSLHCPPCSVDYCLWFPPLCSSHNHCCTLCHLVSHVSLMARSCYIVHTSTFLFYSPHALSPFCLLPQPLFPLSLSLMQCSLYSPTQSAYSF